MARKNETVSGIAFSADAVCLVQYAPDENQVSNFHIHLNEERKTTLWETSAAGIRKLAQALKLSGENVICSIPGEYAIIRRFLLDSNEPDVHEALEWEFSQHIISSRDQYVFAYEKAASPQPGGGEQYFVVGYRNEIVDKINHILKSNRLVPTIIDLDIFALINVYEANYGDGTAPAALCVLADDTVTKIVLTDIGAFRDLEVVAHTEDMISPASYSVAVEKAAAKILSCAGGKYKRESLPVYLSGPLFSHQEFADGVKSTVRNAEMLYPFRKIRCANGMAEEELRKYTPQLAVAVGCALRGGERV
jgi:Tfp pilus assembly PilM family ATPase